MTMIWPLCPDSAVESISFLNHQIRVHRLAVNAFRIVELRARRSEYGARFAAGDIGPTPTGAYNCRNRRPYPETPVTPERHSEHAHAVAIDVDYDSNPLRTDGVLACNFDRFGLDDGADWLASWLEPVQGGPPVLFRWGGGWTTDLQQAVVNLRHNGDRIRSGVVDGMHFELALTPLECQRVDWRAAIAKEEKVNKEIEAAVAFANAVRDELKAGKELATPVGAGKRVGEAVKKVEAQRG